MHTQKLSDLTGTWGLCIDELFLGLIGWLFHNHVFNNHNNNAQLSFFNVSAKLKLRKLNLVFMHSGIELLGAALLTSYSV